MTIARASRSLLASATLLVILWSFASVASRLWKERAPTDRRTRITILHWGTPEEEQIVVELVNRFEAEHPDIRVDRIQASDYMSKLKTMIASGNAPDLFYLMSDNLPEFASMHLLADLEPHLATLPDRDVWLADFYPPVLNAFRFDAAHVGRGPLYGIPKDFTTTVMYANLDLFRRAGLKIPHAGWTWDEFEEACRQISALSDPADRTGPIYGVDFQTFTGVMRPILWSYGADITGADFRDVRMLQPPAQAALEMIRRTRFDEHCAYNSAGMSAGAGQPFFAGKVGMIGPLGRWMTPRFRSISRFEWDVIPLPHDNAPGAGPASALFTVAWSMSANSRHPREAFELLRFLCGHDGQVMMARLGLAIPSMKSAAESNAFLTPGQSPAHTRLFLDEIPRARIAQAPQEPEFERRFQDQLGLAIETGQKTPARAMADFRTEWLAELDSPLKRNHYRTVRWRPIVAVSAAALLSAAGALALLPRRRKPKVLDRRSERIGLLFISPWLLGFVFLALGPMLMAALLSLTRWTGMTPLDTAEFVGFDNFRTMFTADRNLLISLWVTGKYVLMVVPLGQAAALALALLMAGKVRGIALFRTAYFIPTLVTGVALSTLWLSIFNNDYGPLNNFLRPLLRPLHLSPPDWFGKDADLFAIPGFVMMSLWGMGGGMVIYLAALKGVPGSLYEAARIDGASRVRQFFSITLPQISPLFFFNLVMGTIASFQIFTQAKVMRDGGPGTATLVYVLNLYREAFEFHNMGYASALAWFLFAVLLSLTGLLMATSHRWVYYEGLKA